ncbi:LppM family (lipo)protein [Isoptericola sp. BMS4]|uniref:LppM family (lipo)protein n=1 Tax=Isoptericola sp. BMS4 TaxID=2527875 RepID=UPI00141E141B|nr:hypothetical protein [Isoptericola sp. BMS4]
MTTPTRSPHPLRTALAATLAVVGLLALAGCMKIDTDLTLSEDDTVSGSMVMAYSNQFAEQMGMDPQEFWEQAGGDLNSTLAENSTQQPYSDGEYTGAEVTFLDKPLEDFTIRNDAGIQLAITRDGDDYVVDGVMDLSGPDALGPMPEDDMDTLALRIAVTFPGPVSESTGTVEGTTVTWTPAMDEVTEIHAVGSAKGGFPWWLVGLVIGVLVIAVVVVLVVRSNRARAASSAAAAGPVAGPTPDQQVFGAPNPTSPVPTTGPVPEPLEPEAPAAPGEPDASTGPVAEPFEPADGTDESATGADTAAAPSEDTAPAGTTEASPGREDDADGPDDRPTRGA